MKQVKREPAPAPTPTPPRPWWTGPWWTGPWPAVVLGFALFLNSLPNELVYDDHYRVAENPRIRSLANVRAIWLQDWIGAPPAGAERLQPKRDLMYRPLVDFTTAINYALHGLRPAGFRLGNVLLHALACLLVWHFVARLFGDRAVAGLTALLFAVHPIHCEAVVYIVGRAELLAAIFLLLGSLTLLPRAGPVGPRRVLAATPFFLLALLAKESAICYIPVALLILYARREHLPGLSLRGWLTHAAILLLPLVVYAPLRYTALGFQLARTKPFSMLNPLVEADIAGRMIAPFTIMGHYTRLFLWPATLSTEYGLAVVDPRVGPTGMTWLGLAAAVGLLVGLTGYFRRGVAWRRVATLCAIFLVSYFLISNTFILFATTLAERLMYWPSVAVLTLAGLALVGLWRRVAGWTTVPPPAMRAAGAVLGIVLLAALGARSFARNADWATALRLFTKDAATYPQNAQLNANAAVEYLLRAEQTRDATQRRADLERADAYYARALDIFPRHWGFLEHRAQILAQLGKLDEAVAHARLAAQLNPRDPVLQATIASYLLRSRDPAAALKYARQAYALAPRDPRVQFVLVDALTAAGQQAEAVVLLRQLQSQLPAEHPARRQIELRLGQLDAAPATRPAIPP